MSSITLLVSEQAEILLLTADMYAAAAGLVAEGFTRRQFVGLVLSQLRSSRLTCLIGRNVFRQPQLNV